jgi:hypothetical protein
MERLLPRVSLALAAALFAVGGAAGAATPDWNAVADVQEVQVVTQDEDGEERDTTIWLLVMEGQGYIRTGGTRWGDNVLRDPEVVLEIEGESYPLRVEFVEDDADREKIVAAFREKYGWVDGFMEMFRGSRPKIMRLLPR